MDKKRIYIVLLPDILLLDVAGPAEVFTYANRFSESVFELQFVGPEPRVTGSSGMQIMAGPLPETVPADSWILLPGLLGLQLDLDSPGMQQTIQWISRHRQVEKLISVCAGALLLAKAGLLSQRQCTTHHCHLDDLQGIDSSARVLRDRLFVQDGNLYTSAGVTAGIDLALHLVQQECGAVCAAEVARHMVLFARRGPHDPAWSPWLDHRSHVHQGVHKVQDRMQSEPARDWRLAELADIACCSPRHLARLFKAHTGVSTRDYMHKLRITLAHQLLTSEQYTVEQVAQRVGFADIRQFRRIWGRYQDVLPGQVRTRHAAR